MDLVDLREHTVGRRTDVDTIGMGLDQSLAKGFMPASPAWQCVPDAR